MKEVIETRFYELKKEPETGTLLIEFLGDVHADTRIEVEKIMQLSGSLVEAKIKIDEYLELYADTPNRNAKLRQASKHLQKAVTLLNEVNFHDTAAKLDETAKRLMEAAK